MNIQENLCRAFCNGLEVRKVLAGYVVTTPFMLTDKDPIIFYVIADDKNSTIFHIEDDGKQVPLLEASGVDLSTETRSEAFKEILSEYGLSYDTEKCVLTTASMNEDEIAIASLKFVAALLRLQDKKALELFGPYAKLNNLEIEDGGSNA